MIQTTLCSVLAWVQVKCYSTTKTHVFISTVSSAGWWCWIIWWSLQFRLLSLSAGRWMWCLLTGCDLLLIWPYYISVASVKLCAHKELPPSPGQSDTHIFHGCHRCCCCETSSSGIIIIHILVIVTSITSLYAFHWIFFSCFKKAQKALRGKTWWGVLLLSKLRP